MKVTQSLLQLENWTSETNPSEILFLTICSVQVEKVVGVFAKGVQACSDKLLHERESASEKEHGTCKGGGGREGLGEVVDGGLSAGACSVLSHPGWESTLVFLPSFNPQQAFYFDQTPQYVNANKNARAQPSCRNLTTTIIKPWQWEGGQLKRTFTNTTQDMQNVADVAQSDISVYKDLLLCVQKNTITDIKWLYRFIGFSAKSGSGWSSGVEHILVKQKGLTFDCTICKEKVGSKKGLDSLKMVHEGLRYKWAKS